MRRNITSKTLKFAKDSCSKCGGVGWVVSLDNWFLHMFGVTTNQIKVRCNKCNGSGIIKHDHGST